MMKRRGYGAWICLVGLAPFLAAIPAGLSQAGEAGVRIENAWARATPEGSTVGAAYANIQAAGAADTLVSASSPVAGRVEIHTHLVEDGVMKMRRLEKLAIGAGETAKLKPSGDHIRPSRRAPKSPSRSYSKRQARSRLRPGSSRSGPRDRARPRQLPGMRATRWTTARWTTASTRPQGGGLKIRQVSRQPCVEIPSAEVVNGNHQWSRQPQYFSSHTAQLRLTARPRSNMVRSRRTRLIRSKKRWPKSGETGSG
jgi:hypothetical protein